MWTDSHAHLSDCDDDTLNSVVAAAHDAGVTRILNVATSLASSRLVVRQCGLHPSLLGAVGISPHDAGGAPDGWEAQLSEFAADRRIVAIGETGIDAKNASYPDFALQVSCFEKHCAIAGRLGLPLIVHSRGCEQKALDICLACGIRRAVFHCFTGPKVVLARIVDAGYFVSFSGMVTFDKSPVAGLAAFAPLHAILIETDSPYLSPVPHRGEKNQPARLACVGETMARIKNMPPEAFADAVWKNFDALFQTA
jgi:TatD DNase family protein